MNWIINVPLPWLLLLWCFCIGAWFSCIANGDDGIDTGIIATAILACLVGVLLLGGVWL